MAVIGKDISRAQAILESGNLVAIPTETVYGLAGNALDVDAVTKIFKVKNRPSFDPLIVHTNTLEKAKPLLTNIPDLAYCLAAAFWPGPLTLLLDKQPIVPDLVTAGLSRVAIRIPNHPLTLQLLAQLSFPLAAPSANPFGYISPTQASHVNDQLGEQLDYILDGGPCKVGIESTIIGFEADKPLVYRMGGLSLEQIESVTGPVSVKPHSTSNPNAPGMLKSHYSPKKSLLVGKLEDLIKQNKDRNFGVLSFNKSFAEIPAERQIDLSSSGNMEEAAQKLFGALRTLDDAPIDLILTAFLPDQGLGKAINDRLRRASVQ